MRSGSAWEVPGLSTDISGGHLGLSYTAVQRRFLTFAGSRRKFSGSLAGKLHCSRTAVSFEERTEWKRRLSVAQ